MANDSDIEYRHSAADKYNPQRHSYKNAQVMQGLSESIGMLSLEHPLEKSGAFELSVSIPGRSDEEAERLGTNVKKLLEHAGFTPEAESTPNGRLNHFKMKAGPDALIKAAMALSTGFEDAAARKDYRAAMDAKTAGEIIRQELKRQGVSAEKAGLLNFEITAMDDERRGLLGLEKPVSYLDANITHPLSSVIRIWEDGQMAVAGRKALMQMTTGIEIEKGSGALLEAALKKAGIDTASYLVVTKNGHEIHAIAPADVVATALGKEGLLPADCAKEITTKANNLHPDQIKTNQVILEAGRQFLKNLLAEGYGHSSEPPASPGSTAKGKPSKAVRKL